MIAEYAVVRRAGGIGRARGGFERGDEGVDLAFVDERVVGRDAGLAGVARAFRRRSTWRRGIGEIAPVDDRRRLAAELERHRDQVRAGRPHDGAPDARAAGEHQVVERQRGEGFADVGAAGHDRDLIFRRRSLAARPYPVPRGDWNSGRRILICDRPAANPVRN